MARRKRHSVADRRWWLLPEDEAHERITAIVEHIGNSTRGRVESYKRWARLYGNREILALSAGGFDHRPSETPRLKYNGVKAAVNSWLAKIGKARPRPMYLTKDGDYSLRKRAKLMTAFLEGLFHTQAFYATQRHALRMAAVFGTGIIKVSEVDALRDDDGNVLEHGRVQYDSIFPWELRVDPVEGFRGKPRTIYECRTMDRTVLAGLFPDHEEAIMDAPESKGVGFAPFETMSDPVDVTEAIRLPSGPGCDDGRQVIAIRGKTLQDRPWERNHFPYAFFRFDEALAGFWGDGMVEDLEPLQYELNLLLEKQQECLHLMGVPRTYVARGSKVSPPQITNGIGALIYYDGAPPIQETPPSLPPELPGTIAALKDDMFQQVGVSRLSAQSQKPAGLNSGRALREADDIETDRFSIQAINVEEFVLDVADLTVELIREISERDGQYVVKAPVGKHMQVLDWSDVSLEDEAIFVRAYPTALLPTKPAAKIEAVQELMGIGLLTQEDVFRLLDYPDIDHVASLKTAPFDIVDDIIERLIETETQIVPEPYFPLDFAVKRVTEAYNREKLRRNEDDGALERMRRFIDDCQAMIERSKPSPSVPGAGAAPGAGMPAPAGAPGSAGAGAPAPMDPMAAGGMPPPIGAAA